MASTEDEICRVTSCSVETPTYNGCSGSSSFLMDGTPCGSGKLCITGKCTVDSSAPNTDCAMGDGLVYKHYDRSGKFPPYPMECDEFLNYVSKTLSRDPSGYCSDASFSKQCCNACKSKESEIILFYIFY